jgi:methionyl-tRNA formyltransferase
LPRWRGAAPIQRALLAGDSVTGVTIMRMDAGLDTGPMLASSRVSIEASDTAKTLHDRLAPVGAKLMADTLDGVHSGRTRETVQPADGVTYAAKIDKAEAQIQWQRTAAEIARQVRAFNPWPMAETRLNGEQLRIWAAEAIESPALRDTASPGSVLTAAAEGIDVVCGSGILRILNLQLAGRKPLPAAEFLRGQRLDGTRFSAT